MLTRTRTLQLMLGLALTLAGSPAAAQTLPALSGLRLHLKADAGVTTSGGTVSAWADQSGNGFHVAASGSQQPAFAASAINGRPALTLDGNDDFLQSVGSVDLLGGQQNYTFYCVTRPGSTQKAFADIFDYSHSFAVNFVIQQDGGSTNVFYNNGLANQSLTGGQPSIYGGTFVNSSTATATSRLNGGNNQQQTFGGSSNFNVPQFFRVGNWINGGREFNGQIAEILIYNRALTGAEQQQVEAYLSDRYSIPLASPPFGNVVQVNGTTDLVAATAPAFTNTDNFTLEAWVKPAALPTSAFQVIISNGHDGVGGTGSGLALGIGNGTSAGGGSKLSVLFNGVQFFDSGLTLPTANQWYHVAVARRGGTTFAYLDGIQGPNTTTVAPNAIGAASGTALRVGSHRGVSQLQGEVDEARAWSVGRTQAEIQATMGAELTGTETGLAAYWRFNRTGQGAGLTVQNHATSTGAALNGTTVGTATTPVFTGTFATPPFSNVVQLNGAADLVTSAGPAYTQNDNFTLEAWVKPAALPTTGFESIISHNFDDAVANVNGVALGIGAGSGGGGGSNLVVLFSGIAFENTGISFPTAGQWYHVALTRRNGTTFAYLDGVQAPNTFSTTPIAPQASGSSTTKLQVGGHNGLRFLHGEVDEARAWSVGRTQAEIQATMGAELTGAETGLAAYWRFNRTGQGAGLTVQNHATSTGAALNGTTVGTATTPVFTGNITPPATDLSFFPTSGSPGSVVLVTKNSGANFTTATNARFNGASATGTTLNSTTQVTATVPGTATTGTVTAVTGSTTLTGGSFTVTSAPAPAITQFSPVRAPVGTVLTLNGTNFTGVTQVRFGTVAAPGFTVVSPTQLTVPVPTGAPNARIYVLASGGMAQTAGNFTLIAPPTITAFTSAFGTPGAQVVISGTNFTNATAVTFGGGVDAVAFTVNSATLITATVPAGAVTGPLQVTTVAGTATSATSFVVSAPAPPTITAFAPAAGAVGMPVVLTGSNFTGAAGVRFGTTIAPSFTVNSASQITVTVPVGATTSRIAVVTSGGQALTATTFKVVPVPTISSFTPGAGSAGSVVIITGTGLGDATAVRFGGVNAPTFTVNAATSITATVPAGAVSGAIQVTTPGGTATSASSFTVTAPVAPTLTAVNPTSGPAGAVVALTGSFTGVTLVRLGTTAVTSFTVNSPTQITATVPAGAVTGRFFVLATGGLCQSPAFTVIQPPTIGSLTPDNGTIGSTVVVRGTNLTGATAVRFGGVAATTFTVNSATQLTATVPAGAVTGAVSVTTVAGTASSAGAFTVTVPPPPAVSSFTPAAGMAGTLVTITGSNFITVRRVLFNGKDAESFVVLSATSLRAAVPAGASTGPVAVINDGGLGQSAPAFTVQIPPDIDAFTPVRGPVGTVITLAGKGFTGATALTVGGASVTAFTVNSPTKITATVPSGAVTGQISVTTPVATSFSAQDFTLTAARPAGIGWIADEPVQVVPYPNPAVSSQQLTVRVVDWPEYLGQATVELYDALGKRLAIGAVDPKTEEATFELTGLSGIYIVRCAGHARQVLVTP